MAEHLRDQILDALKTTLTGLTTTGARVYADRTEALAENDRPGLTIIQGDESPPEYLTLAYPRTVRAEFTVSVNAYDARTAAQGDARKRANRICKEVQAAIGLDVDLGGLVHDTRTAGTSFELDGGSDNEAASAEMRYRIIYQFKETAPDVAV